MTNNIQEILQRVDNMPGFLSTNAPKYGARFEPLKEQVIIISTVALFTLLFFIAPR